jgi:hypothetical protein
MRKATMLLPALKKVVEIGAYIVAFITIVKFAIGTLEALQTEDEPEPVKPVKDVKPAVK